MTKIAIDRGTGNFILSDLAVLRLYMMGCKHVHVVQHGLTYNPLLGNNSVSDTHTAKMFSVLSNLNLHEASNGTTGLSGSPLWMKKFEDSQSLARALQERGNAAMAGERVFMFGGAQEERLVPVIEGDEWRTDPMLIQVIEDILDDVSAHDSDLMVVEIPDGVDWGIVSRKGASEWIQELSIPQGSHRRGSYRKLRTWSEPHCMPPKYGGAESDELPYVLASDVTEEEWSYAMAMNFAGACPVPTNIRPGNAMYPWDYERWFYWRMAQGDDWRERAKSKWWFNHVHE